VAYLCTISCKRQVDFGLDDPFGANLAPFGRIRTESERFAAAGSSALPLAVLHGDRFDRRRYDRVRRPQINGALGRGKLALPYLELLLRPDRTALSVPVTSTASGASSDPMLLRSASASARLKAARRMRMARSTCLVIVPLSQASDQRRMKTQLYASISVVRRPKGGRAVRLPFRRGIDPVHPSRRESSESLSGSARS